MDRSERLLNAKIPGSDGDRSEEVHLPIWIGYAVWSGLLRQRRSRVKVEAL